MMKARIYDYHEEFDSYVTIVEGENSSLKELSKILYEEKVIEPIYYGKLKLEGSKKYRLIIEKKEYPSYFWSSHFWISENKTKEEQEDITHLTEKREGELDYILKVIRRVPFLN